MYGACVGRHRDGDMLHVVLAHLRATPDRRETNERKVKSKTSHARVMLVFKHKNSSLQINVIPFPDSHFRVRLFRPFAVPFVSAHAQNNYSADKNQPTHSDAHDDSHACSSSTTCWWRRFSERCERRLSKARSAVHARHPKRVVRRRRSLQHVPPS